MARAITPAEKYDVVCELGGACCYAVYEYMNSVRMHSRVPELLRKLDKIARSIVLGSEGLQEGYRLSDYWLHTLFAQIIVIEAESSEKLNESKEHLRKLYSHVGWNYDDSINPIYSNVNTLQKIEFARKYTPEQEIAEKGELFVVMFPTSKNPIGSIWRAKNGNEYTYIGDGDYEANQVSARGRYEIIKPTEYQIGKWERLK
jgi:hypothetical protein